MTFYYSGKINITAHVTRALGLQAGDAVNIARVDKGWTEYYLYIERHANDIMGRHDGTCTVTNGRCRNMRVFSCRLSRYILSLCHADDKVALCIGKAEMVPEIGLAVPIIIHPLHITK